MDSLSLKSLNAENKQLIQYLNKSIDVEIKIKNIKDNIKLLENERAIYVAFIRDTFLENNRISSLYREFFGNEEISHELLSKTYNDMKKKLPSTDPQEWDIVVPFRCTLPDTPKLGYQHTKFAKSIAYGCTNGYRVTMMRYCFLPKLSRRSATAKREELKMAVTQLPPSRQMLSKLKELLCEEKRLKEAINNFSREALNRRQLLDVQMKEYYHQYSEIARRFFLEHKCVDSKFEGGAYFHENTLEQLPDANLSLHPVPFDIFKPQLETRATGIWNDKSEGVFAPCSLSLKSMSQVEFSRRQIQEEPNSAFDPAFDTLLIHTNSPHSPPGTPPTLPTDLTDNQKQQHRITVVNQMMLNEQVIS